MPTTRAVRKNPGQSETNIQGVDVISSFIYVDISAAAAI
jgi:hypothetical protein